MLLLSLSIVLSAQTPDLSKKISFTSVAKPAKRMLADLSPTAGVTLTTSQLMEDEVLILHVNDVPVAEIMKRIASATAGEWQQEGESYRLIRTATKTQELQRQALAKRTAGFKKAIDDYLGKTKDEPFDEEKARIIARDLVRVNEGNSDPFNYNRSAWDRMQTIEGKAPAGRLYNRLLAAVDPAALATLRPGSRIVFSATPTRMQRPFARDVSASVRTFVAEQGTWSEIAKKAVEELGQNPSMYSQALHSSRAPEGAVKALLAVSAMGDGSMISTELIVGDSTGRQIGHFNTHLGQSAFSEPKPEDMQPSPDAALELSPFSEKLAKTIQQQMAIQQGMPNMPPDIRKFLADVDKNDPLSTVTSDALIGWAKAKKLNLVADLPDSCIYTNGVMLLITKVTATSVQRSLEKATDIAVTQADGWAEVRPTDYLETRESRIDRPALAKLLRTGLEKGHWTLDEMATYALTERGSRDFNPAAWFFMALVCPELISLGGHDMAALRLYGTLTTPQRRSLKEGQQLPLGMLTQQQQGFVSAMVFGANSNLMVRPPAQPSPDFYEIAYGIGREPTEAMPNGLPPSGYLAATWEDQLVAYAYVAADQPTGRAFTANELGWDMYARERPDEFPWVRQQQPYALFRPAQRLEIKFDLQLTQSLSLEKELHETQPGQSMKPVPFEQLPAKFKDEAQKTLTDHRNGSRATVGGGNTRKPPPH